MTSLKASISSLASIFCIFTILINASLADPIPRNAASITVQHKGAYVARFKVEFDHDGRRQTYYSGDYTSGFTRSLDLPYGARNVRLIVENATFIATWRVVFTRSWYLATTECWKIYGTTLHPSWELIGC